MRVFAAEVVQKAMLRPHELDVDLTVLVAARPAIVDQELDVDPLLVHVTDASVGIPVMLYRFGALPPTNRPEAAPVVARGSASPSVRGTSAPQPQRLRRC